MSSWLQPITAFLSNILEVLFQWTHDWGLAVVLLTMAVRVLLFRINLGAARQQKRNYLIQPLIKDLREKYAQDQPKLAQETMAVYSKFGVKPMSSLGGAFLQMPVFMALYAVFRTHGEVMSSAFIPWVSHFSQSDPLHVFPLVTALLTFLSSCIPLVELPTPSTGPNRLTMALIATAIPLLVTWRSPVALGLYWLTSSGFGLLEKAFYRLPVGKRLLQRGIPSSLSATSGSS